MHGRRAVAAVAVVLLLALDVGACAPKGAKKIEEESKKHSLTPTYAPVTSSARESAPSGSVTVTAPASAPISTAATTPASSITAATAPTTPITASITDPVGDLTPSPLDPPPPWADLAGADLTLDSSGFTLKVHLGGGQAPTSTDSSHTMNIASFYDLDGDGTVDIEVWANLADSGWATSRFDDRSGKASLQSSSGVLISVEGDAVILRFPSDQLDGAAAFRWSVASEWGRYAAIGTALAARDDMPDNDQPANFPG